MAASARNIACFALLVSILALQVPSSIDQQGTTSAGTAATTADTVSASAPPPFLQGAALKAATVLALLAGMDAVLTAAAVISSRHKHHAADGAGGVSGNWRISVSELAFFALCLQVGVLQFLLFVQQPAGAAAGDDDDAARALGITAAAAHALPCVASVTFFLGTTLVYAHVGNAGSGGAVAGNGPVPAPATVRLLANASACLMSIVLALLYINTNAADKLTI